MLKVKEARHREVKCMVLLIRNSHRQKVVQWLSETGGTVVRSVTL